MSRTESNQRGAEAETDEIKGSPTHGKNAFYTGRWQYAEPRPY